MPGRSLVDFLWIEFGSEVGHYDGMLYGRDFWNIVVGCWTRKMDISPMRESIGKESGAEGGSFGEISVGGSLGSKYGSELGSSGEMLVGYFLGS